MTDTAIKGARPLYRDIAERTDGEMYIGVVGPVRSGKSTFISSFIRRLLLPLVPPGPRRDRLEDEMPQAGSGRSIMTTQPKFVPSEGAIEIRPDETSTVSVRVIDSVGYLIPGATGTQEGEAARMVSTPWSDADMPFEDAAALGTRKVMTDHATIGVVLTTDGTVTELPRSAYVQAEEDIVRQMQALGKPFVIVLNTALPDSADAQSLREALESKYGAPVAALNVKDMSEADARHILSSVLMAFPVREIHFSLPSWVSALDADHWLIGEARQTLKALSGDVKTMRDKALVAEAFASSASLSAPTDERARLGDGSIRYTLPVREGLFNKILSEQCGEDISDDRHLLAMMKELTAAKRAYDRVADALNAAQQTGYGLVTPAMTEVSLDAPELVRQGARCGVRLRATAPTLHLIRSDIETEVTPVLGGEKQSEEFVDFLKSEYEADPERLWDTNFFGKTLRELVRDGLTAKILQMPADAQEKVRLALGKMLNEGDGGMICILL